MNIIRALSLLVGLCIFSAEGNKEKIGILAYGSLVNMPAHSITKAHLCATVFAPTDISFPIGYTLMPKRDRISAVIDINEGIAKRCWGALSCYESFEQAVQNLAAREGAAYNKEHKKYTDRYIFYVKKLKEGQSALADEQPIPYAQGWIMKVEHSFRQRLPDTIIQKIIAWAEAHKATAVLWASCPRVNESTKEMLSELVRNNTLLQNAQRYITKLPDGPQTLFEKAVIDGKKALERYSKGYDKQEKARSTASSTITRLQ